MREMQTIVTDDRGVCLSVCLSVCHAAQLSFTVRVSFGAAFAKSLWPLVFQEATLLYSENEIRLIFG